MNLFSLDKCWNNKILNQFLKNPLKSHNKNSKCTQETEDSHVISKSIYLFESKQIFVPFRSAFYSSAIFAAVSLMDISATCPSILAATLEISVTPAKPGLAVAKSAVSVSTTASARFRERFG